MQDDLLEQAIRLAELDPQKPRQANLRRAVSAAYYGLFHSLVDAACRVILGSQHSQIAYRQVLGRAFTHGAMKQACVSFYGGALKAGAAKGLPATFVAPVEVRTIARTFVDLQQRRQLADYDLTERFTRSDVLGLIEQAETAIRKFEQAPVSIERKFFLACLLAWDTLAKR